MSGQSQPAQASSVSRNALITGAASMVVRMSGLVRDIVFTAVFGAGVAADAYYAAFRAAQFFRELVAEGSLSNAYVPIFSEIAEKQGIKSAWRLANAFMGVLLIVLGLITLITYVFAEDWVWLIASGFATDPDKFALAAQLTRILSPFVACMSFASAFMGMLNVRGHFFLPAVAPAMFNFTVIVGCLGADWLALHSGLDPIAVVGLASLIGGAGQALIQLPALRAEGFRFRPSFTLHPALRKMLAFMIPAFIGVMTVQFNLVVETQIASQFGDGPVTYLNLAFRLVQLPLAVVSGSVAIAALVSLSAMSARGETGRLAGEISEAMTLNSFLVIPAAVGLFLLAEPVISLMFERGEFTAADTAATALVLQMYAVAVWGICTHRVALPCFYALGDPYFPMKVAVVLMAAKVPLALAIVFPMGEAWFGLLDMGYVGLPLSHALLVMFESVVLLWGFTQRVGAFPRQLWADHARILVAAVVMGGVVYALRGWSGGLGVVLVSGIGAVVYFITSFALGLTAARKVLGRMLHREKGLPPTIDPDTRAALQTMAESAEDAVVLEAGELTVTCAAGRFRFVACGGLLTGARVGEGSGEGAPLVVAAVMRIGGGPPMFHGLNLSGRTFRAVADRIVEEAAPGPALPVRPTPGPQTRAG